MKKILISIGAAYLLILVMLYINQRNMMYHPAKQKRELDYYKIDSAEEITLVTKDNIKLQAWFRKPNDNKEMVVFLHGNAGNLENRVDKLRQLSDMGYGFIIPAWRGFGKSGHFPTEKGIYLDAEAAIAYIETKGYKLSETIIIGESLGSGVAAEMSVRYNFKGLFLITPYTSIADRAGEIYPYMFAQYLTKDNFKVLSNITKINQPLLMIHGTKDKVVPCSHSEKIFSIAKEPKKIIIYEGVGHSNYDVKDSFLQMQKFFSSQ
jgi:uncharacterized protein